jgi:hypothetical protein
VFSSSCVKQVRKKVVTTGFSPITFPIQRQLYEKGAVLLAGSDPTSHRSKKSILHVERTGVTWEKESSWGLNCFKIYEVNQMNIGLLIHHSSLIKAVQTLIEHMGYRAVSISQDPGILEHLLDRSSPAEIDLLLMESDVFSVASDILLIQEISRASPSVPLLLLVNEDRLQGLQEAFPHIPLLLQPFRVAELQAALQRFAPITEKSF